MAARTPEQQRLLRRRRRHERQAVVFGALIAALALAGLGATAIYTGAVDAPFLAREFTSPPAEVVPEIPDPPCPTDEMLPVAYEDVEVRVLNSTTTVGLASQTAQALVNRGFTVAGTGNYPAELPIQARISFGPEGLAAAYTLAAHLPSVSMILDTREDATVDLILGEAWSGLLPAGEVTLDPAEPLVGPASCVPLEEVTPVPGPTTPGDEDEGAEPEDDAAEG